jgi:hypothetical protein
MTSRAFQNVRTLNGLFADVRTFGAKGDNVADDLAALNAAYQAVYDAGGGTIYLPAGYYRVTGQWVIGQQQWNSLTFLAERTGVINDATFAANTNSIANGFNNSNRGRGISIEFESGAYLVADFAPATPTPVLGYYLIGDYRERGHIINAAIISAAMVVNGQYNFDGITTLNGATNKLIGLLVRTGLASVQNAHIGGCEHGIIAAAPYWVEIANPRIERAGGIAINAVQANAFTLTNAVIWYSNKGIVFDGDASQLTGIHTQQAAQDLTVYAADCCTFGPGYFEDVETASGAGTYAVRLGATENGNEVTHCVFTGLRVGNTRPSKGAFRFWATRYVTVTGCRAYSETVLYDVQSSGAHLGNDFQPTTAKWTATNPTLEKPSFSMSGTDRIVQGPWYFNVTGIAPGSIASGASANYDFDLPAALDGYSVRTAFATYSSGGNAQLVLTTRDIPGPPAAIRLTFANPSAGAIDPGTFSVALIVFAGEA